ncbi:MAG: hypothetical protein IJ804_10745 [Prevotella sp.]|nr:hypothetical protein [Prevotella sp.]
MTYCVKNISPHALKAWGLFSLDNLVVSNKVRKFAGSNQVIVIMEATTLSHIQKINPADVAGTVEIKI